MSFRIYDDLLETAKGILPDTGEIDYENQINAIALDWYREQFGAFGKLIIHVPQVNKPEWMEKNPETMAVKFDNAKERNLVLENTTKRERATALLQYVRWKRQAG